MASDTDLTRYALDFGGEVIDDATLDSMGEPDSEEAYEDVV